jgi:hypothetical protein
VSSALYRVIKVIDRTYVKEDDEDADGIKKQAEKIEKE